MTKHLEELYCPECKSSDIDSWVKTGYFLDIEKSWYQCEKCQNKFTFIEFLEKEKNIYSAHN